MLDYTLTHNDCLATIGVCVFRALTSVDALFYFTEEIANENIVDNNFCFFAYQ